MGLFQETVRILRNLRAESRIAPQAFANQAFVQTEENSLLAEVLRENGMIMETLTKIRKITLLSPEEEKPAGSLSSQMESGEVSLVVGDILDIAAEIERLSQEMAGMRKNIEPGGENWPTKILSAGRRRRSWRRKRTGSRKMKPVSPGLKKTSQA